MKLNIRRLEKKDLKTAEKWWSEWPKWRSPALDFLPDTGVVVEKEGKLVVIGFIYLTNAKVALLEWIISDPNYRESDREELIELLIKGAEDIVKHLDYKYLFSVVQHKKLIEKHRKLGWVVDDNPSYEITKKLK